MSLTSFIDDSVILRAKFNEEFSKPDFRDKTSIKAPPLTNSHGLIGTAFDYLVRFYVQKLNPCSKARTGWVAETGVACLHDHPRFERAKRVLESAKEQYADYIASSSHSKPDRQLIGAAVRLSYLDVIYRAGILDDNLFKEIPSLILDDLEAIMGLVQPKDFHAKERCLLNPTFGSASLLVGGADADIIIDDRLIDFKCSKHLKFDRLIFNQLIGYYMLSCVGEMDGCPRDAINTLGVYFSRYGLMHQVRITDCIERSRIPVLLKWFTKHAEEFNRKGAD
jgi:hypothetical protein